MNETYEELKVKADFLNLSKYAVVGDSFALIEFACVIDPVNLPYVYNERSSRYEMEKCRELSILFAANGQIIKDTFNLIGVSRLLTQSSLKCTCGHWAIKSANHTDIL